MIRPMIQWPLARKRSARSTSAPAIRAPRRSMRSRVRPRPPTLTPSSPPAGARLHHSTTGSLRPARFPRSGARGESRSGGTSARGLAAAGARAAVAAGVTGACANHAAAAAVELDRVLVRVEQRRLAGRRSLRARRCDRAAVRVLVCELRPHLGGEDARLLLLVDVQELLAEPAEDVVRDRLGGADVRVVRRPGGLEPQVRE